MMPKLILVISIIFFPNSHALGQFNMGARTTAMGETGATATGPWGVIANPAGITAASRPAFALGYASRLGITELSTQSAVLLIPFKQNALGISVERYGFSLFNELRTGFVYGKQFGHNLAIGTRFNYHQINAGNYGTVSSFSFDTGFRYLLHEKIVLGAYISNPTQQKYQETAVNFPIPFSFSIGLAWQASAVVLFAGDLEKEKGSAADFKTGLEYTPDPAISLRGGLAVKPFRHYAGMGIIIKSIDLDFTVTSDPNLGYQPQISMGYAW